MSAPNGTDDFVTLAKAHWTKDREAKVTGKKAWAILPSEAPLLLRTLGLLNADATMSADSLRKFSQINHMVSLLLPHVEDLAKRHATVRILDVCCGTSYLTLLLGWLLAEKLKHPFRIIGVDKNAKVIETSARRAEELGLAKHICFEAVTIDTTYGNDCFSRLFGEGLPGESRPHMMVALHACDTASDLALALGIQAKADVMAVAPCCHSELANKWKDLGDLEHPFSPVFRSPNLRRETAAHLTDAMRLLLVRGRGYEVTATEFVPSTHTPKNRLLVCVRRGKFLKEAEDQYQDLKASLGDRGPRLEELLPHGP